MIVAEGSKGCRISVRLNAETQAKLQEAKRKSGQATASKAIAWAIRTATDPPAEESFRRIAIEVVEWANGLDYASPRERRELRELSRKFYALVGRGI